MNISINHIQVNPGSRTEFISFLESYGFKWPHNKKEINPADYTWIKIHLVNKSIEGNHYLTVHNDGAVLSENDCKSLIKNNFQKKQEVVVGKKYFYENSKSFVVPISTHDGKYVLGGRNCNPFNLYNCLPMTLEEVEKKLQNYKMEP